MVTAETVEDTLFLYVCSLFLELPQLQEMYVLQIVSGYRLLQSSNKMSCASILLGKMCEEHESQPMLLCILSKSFKRSCSWMGAVK